MDSQHGHRAIFGECSGQLVPGADASDDIIESDLECIERRLEVFGPVSRVLYRAKTRYNVL